MAETKKIKNPLNVIKKIKKPAKEVKIKKEVVEVKPIENKVALPKEIFAVENVNSQAIFDTVIFERNSRRQGTHAVKTRATVSGTGKKPWKQKGTGRARAGTLRSPVFVGGGRAFGPQVERNYNVKVNKKVRKLAFNSAMTLLAKENAVLVSDDINLNIAKTKNLVTKLESLGLQGRKHILIISNDENIFMSSRNLKNVHVVKVTSILVENLLWADALVMSNDTLKELEGGNK